MFKVEATEVFSVTSRSFAQERARRTYDALREAALAVFEEKGYDATQTPDIAARAGVSVGTFYRYFADKREVFLEVMQAHLAHAHADVMSRLTPQRFAGQERRAAIEDALSVLLSNFTRHPAVQAVFLEMSLRDAEVGRLRRRFDEESQRRLAELLTAICRPEDVADPAATAYVIYTAVVECALQIAGFRGAPPVSRERALVALTELVVRSLFGIERSAG